MSETETKSICFIDSSYNTLFYVRDGDNIVLTRSDGEKLIHPCKYLDETHVQIGNMFGWSTPAAKTSSYDVRDNPIAPEKAKRHKQKEMER